MISTSLLMREIEFYEKLKNSGDEKLRTWFPFNDPLIPIVILLVYVFWIVIVGQHVMKNRKPYNLKYFVLIYNICQIAFNAYLTKKLIEYIHRNSHTIECLQIEHHSTQSGTELRVALWLYVINKWMDFLDTVFLILQKKRITFFQIYHHATTFVTSWIVGLHFLYGPAVLFATLNSIIHVLVYSYFTLSLFKQFKKISNKLRTIVSSLQIMHILIAASYYIYGVLDEKCNYPKYLIYWVIPQATLMTVMFGTYISHMFFRERSKSNAGNEYKNGHISGKMD